MDWVEKRARHDKAIFRDRQKLWNDLCTALQQAVQSFNRYYNHAGEATAERPYSDHFWVRLRGLGERSAHFVLTLENSIEVEVLATGRIESKFKLLLTVNERGEAALAVDSGKLVNSEEVCKIALESVLFTEPARLHIAILEDTSF